MLLHLCRGPAGPHLDVVAANAGDSGALLVQKRRDEQRSPTPSDDDAPASFTRLSRDHNPDDPLEAVRLANAGARLGRMRQGGEEVGPCEATPAASPCRAPSAISDPRRRLRPEVTRHRVPPRARVVVASDGLWNAMIDAEVAKMTADAYTPEEAADALMRCVVRRRGVHDDVTIVVVDVPEPARAFEDDERDDRTSTGGGDDRTVAVSETIEPPPSSSSAATEPPSDGRSRNPRAVEADVTVRRGVSFDLANGVDGDDEKDARKSGGRRGGGGGFGDGGGFGCFSFLCGSRSAGDDAFDAVDDAFSDGSLLDEYDLGAVLGRGQYGSVRLAYRRKRRASSVRASSARASSVGARASSEASASSVKASADASSFPRRARSR